MASRPVHNDRQRLASRNLTRPGSAKSALRAPVQLLALIVTVQKERIRAAQARAHAAAPSSPAGSWTSVLQGMNPCRTEGRTEKNRPFLLGRTLSGVDTARTPVFLPMHPALASSCPPWCPAGGRRRRPDPGARRTRDRRLSGRHARHVGRRGPPQAPRAGSPGCLLRCGHFRGHLRGRHPRRPPGLGPPGASGHNSAAAEAFAGLRTRNESAGPDTAHRLPGRQRLLLDRDGARCGDADRWRRVRHAGGREPARRGRSPAADGQGQPAAQPRLLLPGARSITDTPSPPSEPVRSRVTKNNQRQHTA